MASGSSGVGVGQRPPPVAVPAERGRCCWRPRTSSEGRSPPRQVAASIARGASPTGLVGARGPPVRRRRGSAGGAGRAGRDRSRRSTSRVRSAHAGRCGLAPDRQPGRRRDGAGLRAGPGRRGRGKRSCRCHHPGDRATHRGRGPRVDGPDSGGSSDDPGQRPRGGSVGEQAATIVVGLGGSATTDGGRRGAGGHRGGRWAR